MRWIKFLLASTVCIFLCWTLTTPTVQLPGFLSKSVPLPLGTFLDPSEGFWQNATSNNQAPAGTLELAGLKASVEIVLDDRGVPHIFAENDQDLYMAQGYMEARDRLWQMEFQTHAAAGRLSEIIGDAAVNYDKRMRRLGLAYAAEKADEVISGGDKEIAQVLDAYSKGVNAYIETLSPEDYPIEYKLLGYAPEPWKPLKTWLLLKYMSNILTGGGDDVAMTQAFDLFGAAYAEVLYPDRSYEEEPIISKDHRWDFRPEAIPAVPEGYHPDSLLLPGKPFEQQDAVGSNNWAVHGSKSATGKPLLANDPHLSLGLPSVWYELQLKSQDHNVYGVSFPGTPGMMIGFNDSIAWGVTNGSIDVQDYYRISFTDASQKFYHFGDTTLPVTRRIETIKLKSGGVAYDTVMYTHHGPVFYDGSFGEIDVPMALRWTAHDPSNELRTFIELNAARNFTEYKQAISHYACPGQNFVFASTEGDVAMTQQGKFPLRWEGQGRYVLDGSDPAHDWQGFIPTEHNPVEKNPPRGYVASTNQHPTSPNYPYYYNGFFVEDRSRQLAELMLRDSLSVDDMKAFQQDVLNVKARDLLPVLLGSLDSSLNNAKQSLVRDRLAAWNYRHEKDASEPIMYQLWENLMYRAIWNDELTAKNRKVSYPKRETTIGILRDSIDFRFYDDIGTPAVETRADLIRSTFVTMVDSLYRYNEDPAAWKWYAWKGTSIRHLMDRGTLSSFSSLDVPIGGYKGILNATSARWGPSWRMVVSLGDKVEAWGVYPGGQSGNPGSPNYDRFIADWAAGNYYPLWFMQNASEQDERFSSKISVQSSK
ncbi:MAG: penicillin acylase family protein [Bacteroidia bacterium]